MIRKHRFFAAMVAGTLSGVSGAATAASPYAVIEPDDVLQQSPAYRYANMTSEQALAELDRRGIEYVEVDAVPGVRAPIRLNGALHGVQIHSSLPAEERATSRFEIVDARMALALDDFSALLAKHDVVELVHYTMYRPNVAKPSARDSMQAEGSARMHADKGKDGAGDPDAGKAPAQAKTKKKASKPKAKPKAPAKPSKTAAKAKPAKPATPAAPVPPAAPAKPEEKVAQKPAPVMEPAAAKGAPIEAPMGEAEKPAAAPAPAPKPHHDKAKDKAHKDKADKPKSLPPAKAGVEQAPKAHGESQKPHEKSKPAKTKTHGKDKGKQAEREAAPVQHAVLETSEPVETLEKKVTWAPPGTRHPAGLAIDVGGLRKSDGTWLSIADHFGGHVGARTCGDGAKPPVSSEGRELWSIVCEARQAGLFSYVLTPNYNAAHADHFHMEIKGGSRLVLYQ